MDSSKKEMTCDDVNWGFEVDAQKTSPCTISHKSTIKAIWDFILFILILYTAIMSPYLASFIYIQNRRDAADGAGNYKKNDTYATNDPFRIVDLVLDLLFILDIMVNFRTTYNDVDDKEITDSCEIAKHYLKGWFIIDLLGAIPYELLVEIANAEQYSSLIGILKAARLLRFIKVALSLDRFTEYGIFLILFLMGGFAIIAHWFACIWYIIGTIDLENKSKIGWLSQLMEESNINLNNSNIQSALRNRDAYLTSMYFVLTSLTSVGFGNVYATTNNEKIFSIIVMVGGALIHAVVFGNVSAIIQRLYSGMAQYHMKMRKVKEFIRFYQLPYRLRKRLETYAEYEYSYTNGIDMNEVLQIFPAGIQADVCFHLTQNLLSSNAVFKDSSPGCLRSLSLKLRTTHSLPGDYVIEADDEVTSIYWIRRGAVEVIIDEECHSVLGKGDSFGSSFNFPYQQSACKSAAYVRSIVFCDFHSISQQDLIEVMRAYPEFGKSFSHGIPITCDVGKSLKKDRHEISSLIIPNSPTEIKEENGCPNSEEMEKHKIYPEETKNEPVHIASSGGSHCANSNGSANNISKYISEDIDEIKLRMEQLEYSMKKEMTMLKELLIYDDTLMMETSI